ncbi:hypothetical protein [Bosea sp. (in: a-proteobacteria)]
MKRKSVKHSDLSKDQLGELLQAQIGFNQRMVLVAQKLLEELDPSQISSSNRTILMDFHAAVNALVADLNNQSDRVLASSNHVSEMLQ